MAARSGPLAVVDRFRPRTDTRFLRRVVDAARRHAGEPGLPVSLLLTDDRGIAAIHAQHLGDRSATDVISFRIDDEAELVVSVERARRIAHENGHPIRAELALYVVHGILHVCGFDDHTQRQRRAMRAKEREVLATLGYVIDAFE